MAQSTDLMRELINGHLQAMGWRQIKPQKANKKSWFKFYPPPHEIPSGQKDLNLTVIARWKDATWDKDMIRARNFAIEEGATRQ